MTEDFDTKLTGDFIPEDPFMPIIKIRYASPDIIPIEQTDNGDWIDLRAAEDYEFKAFEYGKINLGVAMDIPNEYEAHVVPRSSTFEKFGIIMTNSTGIIDHTYCGNNDFWRFPALAIRPTVIHKNDRICQFRIYERMKKVCIKPVIDLGNPDRGGFGTTGIK